MATDTGAAGAAATATKPVDIGLKREMGLIGATWASETSIIGSGWLFGALFAAQAAGTAALLGWVIGGVIIIILALVHAELGAMYPVAGGTARFPHFAFGSITGISFGFFSWLQAVTVAPIECFAVMQYGSYYWHGLYNANTSNVTGLGFGMTIILMAIFTAINFLAMRLFSKVNAGSPGGRSPSRSSPSSCWRSSSTPTTSGRAAASCRSGSRPCSPRSPRPASCSPTSASSRPTSWRARSRTRRRTCPGRSSSPA